MKSKKLQLKWEGITLPEIFRQVAKYTDEKLDRAFQDVLGVEHLPENMYEVPGMDLTDKGRVWDYDKYQKNLKIYSQFVKEKEALKVAFAHVDSFVLHKDVFYELCKEFGLMRIYQSKFENWYLVEKQNFNAGIEHGKIGEQIKYVENEIKTRNWDESYYKRVNFFQFFSYQDKVDFIVVGGWVIGGILGVSYLASWLFETSTPFGVGMISSILITLIAILVVVLKFKSGKKTEIGYAINRQKKLKERVNQLKEEQKVSIFYKFFPDMILSSPETKKYKNTFYSDSKEWIEKVVKNGSTIYGSIQIEVIPPPENKRKKIVEILSKLPPNHKFKVCTLADPRTIKINKISAPINPPPPRVYDPGVSVEYGNYAIVFPETFYHVTDLEYKFLSKAIRVAEVWNERKYILS